MHESANPDDADARFWAVFESAGTPMLVADDDRRYVAANDAACALLGLEREGIVGRRIDDLTPPAARADVPALWHRFLRDGSQTAEYRLVRPDGREVAVEYSATAHVLPGRHVTIFVTTPDEQARDAGDPGVLTVREREVLGHIAMGRTSPQIAQMLGISPKTVSNHTESVLAKLRARTRAHAIAIALRDGELSLPADRGTR